MDIQTNLFGDVPYQTFDAKPSKAERIASMEAAMKAEKNQKCIEAFRPFLIEFNKNNSLFIMADVVEAYLKAKLPRPHLDFRCVGGIVNSLTKSGVLVWTGDWRIVEGGTGRNAKIYRGQ